MFVLFIAFIALPVLFGFGCILTHRGIRPRRTDDTPPEPPRNGRRDIYLGEGCDRINVGVSHHPIPQPPPRDERREYCNLKGLDRIIVDVSPRPVPLSSDLANRTNSERLIRTQEK